MDLDSVVKNQKPYLGDLVEVTMYQGVHDKLHKHLRRNFQCRETVELILNLTAFQIPVDESHRGFELCQEVSLHIGADKAVSEPVSAQVVTYESDASDCEDWIEFQDILSKKQKAGQCQSAFVVHQGCVLQNSLRCDSGSDSADKILD